MARKQRKAQETQQVAQPQAPAPSKGLSPSLPKKTFSEGLLLLHEMIEDGYEDLDILIALNENLDKETSEKVLAEARRSGDF